MPKFKSKDEQFSIVVLTNKGRKFLGIKEEQSPTKPCTTCNGTGQCDCGDECDDCIDGVCAGCLGDGLDPLVSSERTYTAEPETHADFILSVAARLVGKECHFVGGE